MWGNPDSKRPFERPNVNGRIILKWTLKNGMAECGLDSSDSGYGLMVAT